MKVFKLYLKLVWTSKTILIIYLGIFVGLAFLFFSSNTTTEVGFENQKINIAIINEDENSDLINGLKDHLSSYATYVDVKKEEIDDAIFFEQIVVAIIIPENFTEDFINDNSPEIIRKSTPDETRPTYTVNNAINKYLNLVNVYKTNTHRDLPTILKLVNVDLKTEADANVLQIQDTALESSRYFYNYSAYIVAVIMIIMIGVIMIRFKNLDIKRRLQSSPYPEHRTNIELTMGHATLSLILLLALFLMTLYFYPTIVFTTHGLFYAINSICYIIANIAIGYIIGLLVKTEDSLAAVSNIVGLGLSFLTGAFIPQQLLADGLIKFAHLFPSYYFIANNNAISGLSNFSWESINNVVLFMGIQILFAIGLFLISMFIRKKQLSQEA